MGLDTVELVMEVEDRFGVTLPDAECSRVRTVADLAALVISRLPKHTGVCPTARRFFEVRRVMMSTLDVPRRAVRPDAQLADLLGPKLQRSWKALRRSDRSLPSLHSTPRVDSIALLMTAFVVMSCAIPIAFAFATYGVFAGALAFILAIGAIIAFASIPVLLASELPAGLATVGDLARATARFEHPQDAPGERLIAQQRVLEEVRRITSEQLSIPLDKVKPESDFVKDLGAD